MTPEQDRQFQRNTVRSRARPCVRNLLANLPRLSSHGAAIGGEAPRDTERAAVIVGAGPTLEAVLPILSMLRDRVVLFACTQALGALARGGIVADVLVAIESVDVSQHVTPVNFRSAVFDLTAHPALVEAVVRGAPDASWIASPSPESSDIALALGSEPLRYGPSTTTACAALAYAWGLREIVLVGCPLAYTEARAYAAGAGWDGLRVEMAEGRVRTSGRPDRDEAHAADGIALVGRDRELVDVPSVHGGTVPTTRDYEAQIEWFARAAERWTDATLHNASEGAAIEGWPRRAPAVAQWPSPKEGWWAHPVPRYTLADDLRAVLTGAIAECTRAEQIAAAVLLGEGLAPLLGRPCYPSLVESWRAPDMIDLRDAVRAGKLTHDAAIARAYEALGLAAINVRNGLLAAMERIG